MPKASSGTQTKKLIKGISNRREKHPEHEKHVQNTVNELIKHGAEVPGGRKGHISKLVGKAFENMKKEGKEKPDFSALHTFIEKTKAKADGTYIEEKRPYKTDESSNAFGNLAGNPNRRSLKLTSESLESRAKETYTEASVFHKGKGMGTTADWIKTGGKQTFNRRKEFEKSLEKVNNSIKKTNAEIEEFKANLKEQHEKNGVSPEPLKKELENRRKIRTELERSKKYIEEEIKKPEHNRDFIRMYVEPEAAEKFHEEFLNKGRGYPILKSELLDMYENVGKYDENSRRALEVDKNGKHVLDKEGNPKVVLVNQKGKKVGEVKRVKKVMLEVPALGSQRAAKDGYYDAVLGLYGRKDTIVSSGISIKERTREEKTKKEEEIEDISADVDWDYKEKDKEFVPPETGFYKKPAKGPEGEWRKRMEEFEEMGKRRKTIPEKEMEKEKEVQAEQKGEKKIKGGSSFFGGGGGGSDLGDIWRLLLILLLIAILLGLLSDFF